MNSPNAYSKVLAGGVWLRLLQDRCAIPTYPAAALALCALAYKPGGSRTTTMKFQPSRAAADVRLGDILITSTAQASPWRLAAR